MLLLSALAVVLLGWMFWEFRTAPYLDEESGRFIDYHTFERMRKDSQDADSDTLP